MTVIVCPKCSKQHRVNIANIPEGKRIAARCKACGHKFPVILQQLMPDSGTDMAEVKKQSELLKNKVPPISSPNTPPLPEAKKAAEQPAISSVTEQLQEQQPELPAKKTETTRRISVSLSKGGVGKTTTSVNLSAGLALAGYKVLLIDTDTQGQSAYNLGKKPGAGLTELLTGELTAEEATIEARKNLWLLAGGRSLAGVKRIIDKKSFGAEWTMSEALSQVDHKYDFVIIDTSPGWDQLTINVLFYATEILVPVALQVMSLQGLSEFMKSLSSIHKYRQDVSLKYIVPTFMDTRVKHPQEIFKKLKQLYSQFICKPIRYNESFSEAPSYGKTIFEFAPGCNGALDYKELIRKVAQDETLLL
ncbi:ParA family protein [Desulfamplus magnetovallimortis]|uniref:ParA family protein n=1 Tax=Desulfamplus magnetovallimortis TaxID=1246637 RepID=A0A1W1HFX1_9BACT|nr:AAA family ATPase [Desulfamplus magnetovallimortis]SLM31295.1 ParA family protein [Desulfamplus magnetovallimortis]